MQMLQTVSLVLTSAEIATLVHQQFLKDNPEWSGKVVSTDLRDSVVVTLVVERNNEKVKASTEEETSCQHPVEDGK